MAIGFVYHLAEIQQTHGAGSLTLLCGMKSVLSKVKSRLHLCWNNDYWLIVFVQKFGFKMAINFLCVPMDKITYCSGNYIWVHPWVSVINKTINFTQIQTSSDWKGIEVWYLNEKLTTRVINSFNIWYSGYVESGRCKSAKKHEILLEVIDEVGHERDKHVINTFLNKAFTVWTVEYFHPVLIFFCTSKQNLIGIILDRNFEDEMKST